MQYVFSVYFFSVYIIQYVIATTVEMGVAVTKI